MVFLAIACLVSVNAASEGFYLIEQELSITKVSWSKGGQNSGPDTNVQFVDAPLKESDKSVELTYHFLGVSGQLNNCEYGVSLPLHGNSEILKVWLYGDGSGHNFILRLRDDTGQVLQYRGVPITWEGWRLVEIKLRDPAALQTFWDGANDGVVRDNIRIYSFLIEPRPMSLVGKGKVYIGGVSVTAKLPESESLLMEVATSKLGNIFTTDDRIQFTLKFTNYADRDRQLNIRYWVETYNDRVYLLNNITAAVEANKETTRDIVLNSFNLNGTFELVLQVNSLDNVIMFRKRVPFSRILPPSNNRRTSIVGAQTHFAHGLARNPLDENLELLRLSGATWYRDEMTWSNAEKVKGKMEILPEWDMRIDKSLELGLIPLLELNFGNRFYDEGGAPYTEEGIAGFVRYCRTMVEHFKGRINHFEIWNEYNIKGFNPTNRPPEDYARLLKAVYPAIKEINPNATVIGCSTAGVDLGWIERVFEAGGYDYMDAVSIHPYSWPRGPEESGYLRNLQLLLDLMKRYGEVKPIWVTEIGWPTHTATNGVSEIKSGAFAVRAYVLTLASGFPVDMFNWYNLQDKGTDPLYSEDNFGLVKHSGGVEVPFAAKQNFVAFSTMNRMLEGAEYLERLESDSYIHAYKFALPQGEQMIVLWAVNRQESLGIKTASRQVVMVDIFGNRYPLATVDGIVTVTASDYPIYLLGDFSNAAICRPRFSLTQSSINSLAGEFVTIELVSAEDNYDVQQLAVDLPRGWTVKEQKVFSEDNQQAKLVIQLPANVDKKTYELPIYLVGKQQVLGYLLANISVGEPLDLQINPVLRETGNWEKWDIGLTVINRTSTRPTNGVINILKPAELASRTGALEFTLAPNEQYTFKLPLQTVPTTPIEIAVEVSSAYGDYLQLERNISFLAAVRRTAPLNIDGEILDVEWGRAMPFKLNQASQIKEISGWRGVDDLSGVGYLQWDDEYLYLAVVATDDIHNQEGVGSDIWSGDSIQFAIDPARKWSIGIDGHHELGFALGKQGIIGWRWIAAYGKELGPLPESVKLAVKREGNITKYEAAIPWNELVMVQPQPGTLLGFSLLINDNDGYGRRGWIEYMSGIGSGKNPHLFGDLLLIE